MPKFEALLLDMDGVVIDSEPIHDAAQRIVFSEYDLDVPDSMFGAFRGMRERDIFEHIVTEYAGGNGDVDELLAAKERTYRMLLTDLTLVPGALIFIANARERFRLALTTSSTLVDQQIAFRKFGLAQYFEAIVTAEDIEHSKPHPEPYLKTAARMGIKPSACLVIEDSLNGVLSAVRAGCTVAGMTTSFNSDDLRSAGAHFTIETFAALAERLDVRMASSG